MRNRLRVITASDRPSNLKHMEYECNVARASSIAKTLPCGIQVDNFLANNHPIRSPPKICSKKTFHNRYLSTTLAMSTHCALADSAFPVNGYAVFPVTF